MARLRKRAPVAIRTAEIREMTERAPEAVREYLISHNAIERVCDALLRGIDNDQRSDKRMVLEALGAVGAQHQIAIVLNQRIQALGARDEDEARELIGEGHRLRKLTADATASIEDCANEAVDLLVVAFRGRPDLRDAMLARLGVSTNANINGNGSTNGNGAHE